MQPPTIEEFVAARGEALLRGALMLCGSPHEAEDLVQAVLAKVYPRWARISTLDQPEAYVRKVLVHEQLRRSRRRWRRELAMPAVHAEPAASDDTDAYASRDAAWSLLAGLPGRQRAVLVLRYYEDLSDPEIATVLGCRASTVRSQAARALATLRAALPTMHTEALP
ncbi:MAG: SigE family RNA polymerase sigma factor [Sporichthyaceae bacterium]|nr:SigE family RNA polymerase sigma factor [Sporichthyaceae bacterium]